MRRMLADEPGAHKRRHIYACACTGGVPPLDRRSTPARTLLCIGERLTEGARMNTSAGQKRAIPSPIGASRPDGGQTEMMRSLAATLVLCSLVLAAAGLAGAATPPPPPKFWTVSRCERTLHVQGADGAVTADGYGFHVGLRVCVGTGGSQACEWAADHRSRLYSQFRVFSRSRYIGGIVRSWTLTTRGGAGLVAIRRYPETSPSAGPPTSSCRQLASGSSHQMPLRHAFARSLRRSRPASRNSRTPPTARAGSRRSRG